MKKLLSISAIILAIFVISTKQANGQRRDIDRNQPLWDVVDNNRDIIRRGHYRIEADSYRYGRGYGLETIIDLIFRGRHARHRDCQRYDDCNDNYPERSSRQRKEKDDRQYRTERTVFLQKHYITNLSYDNVRILLDDYLLEMPKGGIFLRPMHRISITMPEDEDFRVDALIYTNQGTTRVELVQDRSGNFIIR